MAHCILRFRDNYYTVQEDWLIDGVAIVCALFQQQSSSEVPADWQQMMSDLQEYTREKGGMGILNPPFDAWLRDDDSIHRFASFLGEGVKRLRATGNTLPLALVRVAVSEPDRFPIDPPIWPYIRALGQLRALILQGKSPPLSSDQFFLPFRGEYRVFNVDQFLDSIALGAYLVSTTHKSTTWKNEYFEIGEKWKRFCESTQGDRHPKFSVRINDPPLDQWFADDVKAVLCVEWFDIAISEALALGSELSLPLLHRVLNRPQRSTEFPVVASCVSTLGQVRSLIASALE